MAAVDATRAGHDSGDRGGSRRGAPELPVGGGGAAARFTTRDTRCGNARTRGRGGLLSRGIACWLARRDGESRAANGLVAAMLLYYAAVVAILAFAGLGAGLRGVALWPAVVLHAALAVWCTARLRSERLNMDAARDTGDAP